MTAGRVRRDVGVGLEALGIDDLRHRRAAARRQLEIARLRAQQGQRQEDLDRLEDTVVALTDELITRYQADLSLVDSLLDPAYPSKVGATGGVGS